MPTRRDQKPEGSSDDRQKQDGGDGPGPPDELTDSLLGRMLSAANEQIADPHQADAAVTAAMEEVARRHAGQPLVLEPVGIELIEALLVAQFPLFASRDTLRNRAAKAIAQSLLADPTARVRLENLWASLGERVK